MTDNLSELQNQYSIGEHVVFKQADNGLISIEVANRHANATIQLQGAHISEWTLHDQPAVIWLSEDAVFAEAKSLRGGIPICWPWFGAHESDSSLPAHGYARTVEWQLIDTKLLDNDVVQLVFRIVNDEASRSMWPCPTELDYIVTIGKTLELDLITRNVGAASITIGDALHTYFNVSDVRKVSIAGLDGCDYLDKVDGFKRKQQSGLVTINEEVDRVYLGSSADCVIDDPGCKRRIVIKKRGSLTTVVWNPWCETAAKMGDLGEDGYLNMLCVESANAANDVVRLEPGEQHHLWVSYAVETYI